MQKDSINQWHNTANIKADRLNEVFNIELKEYYYVMSVVKIAFRFINNVDCVWFDDVNSININVNMNQNCFKLRF